MTTLGKTPIWMLYDAMMLWCYDAMIDHKVVNIPIFYIKSIQACLLKLWPSLKQSSSIMRQLSIIPPYCRPSIGCGVQLWAGGHCNHAYGRQAVQRLADISAIHSFVRFYFKTQLTLYYGQYLKYIVWGRLSLSCSQWSPSFHFDNPASRKYLNISPTTGIFWIQP